MVLITHQTKRTNIVMEVLPENRHEVLELIKRLADLACCDMEPPEWGAEVLLERLLDADLSGMAPREA